MTPRQWAAALARMLCEMAEDGVRIDGELLLSREGNAWVRVGAEQVTTRDAVETHAQEGPNP